MADHEIRILKGDTSNGTLTLSDGGYTNASPGDKITWVIDGNAQVNSIKLIKKKPHSRNIFSRGPQARGRDWDGKISPMPSRRIYEYSIYWKADDGSSHEYDPKIAVNPKFSFLTGFIVVSLTFLSLFSLLFLGKKKKQRQVREDFQQYGD